MKLNLGFPFNPKSFNPLNFTMNGKKLIETDQAFKPLNPMELLEALSSINPDDESKPNKIKALKDMYDKINPL